MPQFPLPFDPLADDDFDIAFESPPRRASRPASNNNGARRQSAPPRAQTSRGRAAAPAIVPDDEADWDAPAPKRASAAKRPPTERSNAERPKTGQSHSRRGQGAKSRDKVARPPKSPRRLRAVHYEVAGVLLLAFGGLFGFYALRSSVDGALPRLVLGALRWACGAGALAVPLALALLGILLLVKRQNANLRSFWRGAGVALLVFITAKSLAVPRGAEFFDAEIIRSHGGYIGAGVAWALRRALGELGAVVTLVALGIVALLLWTEHTFGELGDDWRQKIGDLWGTLRQKFSHQKSKRKSERAQARAERESQRQAEQDENDDEDEQWDDDECEEDAAPRSLPRRVVREAHEDERAHRPSPFFPVDELLDAPPAPPSRRPRALDIAPNSTAAAPAVDPDSTIESPQPAKPRVEFLDSAPPPSVVDALNIDIEAALAGANADRELTPNELLEAQAEASATEGRSPLPRIVRVEKPRRSFGDGPLMPEYFDDGVRALDPPVPPDNAGAEEEIERGVEGVQETLASFKIDARVTDVKRGPVITRYEVQPGAGVRVNAIANLDKDLARALSALAVRIEAPVPGKNVVGIEIPNKKVHLVRMRDVLEQPEFLAHPSKLAFVLGKDIAGQPKWGDLTKMPHMLIAGATNSGKSVCLNSIITSILVRARPDEVRFSLIDPKRVELTLYRGIRHLMHDVVVEPKQAVIALRRAIEEMDRRYKLFAANGVRNIVSYNAKLGPDKKPLPYIVIVIDELADLMMTAAAEFEKLICRLAQLARATGIHLIVATQRPSVNVITGVIKANIPARIAFAVASQVDSRTILDSVGAERLIGSGDMLYDSNNGGKSTRIQGAFLSEDEVNRVVEVVKRAYQYDDDDQFDELPEFDLFVPDDDDDEWADSPADEKRDALYDEIVEFCKRHQEMSASNIQRKFGIGYPRAGRIVDQLERHGILGPADGPKPRKVLAAGRDEED